MQEKRTEEKNQNLQFNEQLSQRSTQIKIPQS